MGNSGNTSQSAPPPVPDGGTDTDKWLKDWAAANVDYLTEMCLGPAVDLILAGWEAGGTGLPWNDAASDNAISNKEN